MVSGSGLGSCKWLIRTRLVGQHERVNWTGLHRILASTLGMVFMKVLLLGKDNVRVRVRVVLTVRVGLVFVFRVSIDGRVELGIGLLSGSGSGLGSGLGLGLGLEWAYCAVLEIWLESIVQG